jgi:cell division protein FtsI (penicillin-binding protein 3)
VISSLTAAKMKRMLEGVVLRGTGKMAVLDGYTSAGKTGTAQKINPVTHRYDKVNYIASFSGFAPINDPAITVTVIVDSPKGLHEGGYIAPYFSHIAQQVLEYLDVPHDVDVKNPQRMLLRASARPESEGLPDHVGEEVAANDSVEETTQVATASGTQQPAGVIPAGYHPSSAVDTQQTASLLADTTKATESQKPIPLPTSGTVVLDVDAEKTVPSFLGKPIRAVIEESEKAGLEIDVFGSGVAREQNPPPGSRLPSGGHVTVQFAR